jgi:acyl transferase domain-containing protein
MLSPDGRCSTFDAKANGYVRGEGCGVIALKPLATAVKSSDSIGAVLRGSAINHGGHASTLTAPNGTAQQAVLKAAQLNASVQPDEVGCIEAHGTGTKLGDPVEIHALAGVFSSRSTEKPLYVSSIKTNIGHLEAASGIAAVIKSVLSLKAAQIPQHLHLESLNPLISFGEVPIKIPQTLTPWPVDQSRLAGASAFGFSGTNAHVLLEAAEEPTHASTADEGGMFALSARTDASLRLQAKHLAEHLTSTMARGATVRLDRLCHTLSFRRQQFTHRLAAKVKSMPDLIDDLNKVANGQTPSVLAISGDIRPKVAMLFTGQGSQYAGMGKRLYETQPLFRDILDECDQLLQPVLKCSLVNDIIFGSGSLVDQTQYTQPALFSFEYALARLYMSWGVEPDVVMGHSVGEYVAACIAGVFSLADGLKLIATRAQLMGNIQAGGVMVAVFASIDVVQPKLVGHESQASIAAVNGPGLVVVSGAPAAVDEIVASLNNSGVKSKQLTVSDAFHSPLMKPMLRMFGMVTNMANFAEPKIPFVSNVLGKVVPAGTVNTGKYWQDHVCAAVNFNAGMQALEEFGATVLVEIGPNPVLAGMGKRCLSTGSSAVFVPTVKRGQDDATCVEQSLAPLFALGTALQLGMASQQAEDSDSQPLQDLPVYPFDGRRYWKPL